MGERLEKPVSPTDAIALAWDWLQQVVQSRHSPLTLTFFSSLTCALLVATLFLVRRRRMRNRPVRPRTILRALFPKGLSGHPSVRADLGYMLLALVGFGAIIAWAVLSYQVLSNAVVGWLVWGFGAGAPTTLPAIVTGGILTLALFLAYELAYWFDHYLKHRVPILWEFHKVHHEATVLTPLTVFRVHPMDALIHSNITAVLTGLTNGAVNYLFGTTTYLYAIQDTNLILVLFLHAYTHLQHSQFWMPASGLLGRIILSPAHHQVHHSADPVNFNKNLGACLAIWDWMFGTLYVPAKRSEKLTFGVDPAPGERAPERVHSIPRSLIVPFLRAFSQLAAMLGIRSPAPPAPATGIADFPGGAGR